MWKSERKKWSVVKTLCLAVSSVVMMSFSAGLTYGATGGTETNSTVTVGKDITSALVGNIHNIYSYTGHQIKPVPYITWKGTKLEEGVDYTLEYEENIESKTQGVIKITGIGDYSGEVTKTFYIEPCRFNEKNITVTVEDVTYTGEPNKPAVSVIYGKGTPDEFALVEGVDYKIYSLLNHKNASTDTNKASVILVGLNNFANTLSSSIKVEFSVLPADISEATIDPLPDVTYTGSSYLPRPQVTFNGMTLTEGKDFTRSAGNSDGDSDNTNASTATVKGRVTIHGTGNYTGTQDVEFTIKPASMEETYRELIYAQEYTGSPIEPDTVITYGRPVQTLVNGKDYTVTYKNNVNISVEDKAVATFTAIEGSNFTGSVDVRFKIAPASIKRAEIIANDQEYTGTADHSAVEVKLDGRTLTEGEDYVLYYLYGGTSGGTDPGTVMFKVAGINNYNNEKEGSFTILPYSISNLEEQVDLSSNTFTYDGTEQTVSGINLVYGSRELKEGTDYDISYENNVNPGTATLKIEGKGKYGGVITKNFTIAPISIEGAVLSAVEDQTYTGKEIQPSVSVTLNGQELQADTEFTLSYENNVHVAAADAAKAPTILVKGNGNYGGTVKGTFAILPVSLKEAVVAAVPDQTANGAAIKPALQVTFNGTALKEGTDYSAAYSQNISAGTAAYELTGMGDFKDKLTGNFTIKEVPVTTETAAAPAPTPTQGAPGKIVSAAQAESTILSASKDKDPEFASFGLLQARVGKAAKSAITVRWTRVAGAKEYVIYGSKCGQKCQKLATVTGTKYIQKKLTKGTYYKYIVAAVDQNGYAIATSKMIHVATKGGKVGNYSKVTLNKKSVTLKKGKSFKLVMKAKPAAGVKVKVHRKSAYESSNTDVAKVNKKGVIKAVGKGSCVVYAYAQDGTFAKIKVKVK